MTYPGPPPDDSLLTVTVNWVPPGYSNKDRPNRTVDGSPAAVHFGSADSGSITLYRNGYEVVVDVHGRAARRLIDEKAAIDIATSLTPTAGAPSDRTQWTDHPLR